jgi:nucleotide-binding universal stress UspA family protein
MTGTMTYSSTDVETKANAHDVNLVVIGSRSMTTSAGRWAIGIHGEIRRHGSVDRVIHGNSGATSHAGLLDTAAR